MLAKGLLDETEERWPRVMDLSESQAWQLKEGIESDSEGDHGLLPMLDSRSALAEKLLRFLDSVV